MKNNYDRVAGFYDSLSALVYGNSIKNSQICLLDLIKAGDRVLIAGGGTGWILEEISKIHSSGLDITYVEISEKMIGQARTKSGGQNQLRFVNLPIEEFAASHNKSHQSDYTVVITAFLFDNFRKEKAEDVFLKLHNLLTPDGLWLFTDFSYEKRKDGIWKGFLLAMMYALFKTICNVEASELPAMEKHFEKHHYLSIRTGSYFSGFIRTTAYRKNRSCL